MSESTQYKRLYSIDGDIIPSSFENGGEREWQQYPGNRRNECLTENNNNDNGNPPRGSILVKTGGNALQAIDRDVLDRTHFISVIVPDGKEAGDTILVNCPYWKGRIIKTTIPKGAEPGDSFVVQTPPMIPHVVTGVPVDPADDEEAAIDSGRDIIAAAAEHELALREESRNNTANSPGVEMMASTNNNNNNQRDAQGGPNGKGWVAAMFMGKLMLG